MDEALPSWENIVKWVTVSSNHLAVGFAASLWRDAERQSKETVQWIDYLSGKNGKSWIGPGATAFRAHLKDLSSAVTANMKHQGDTAEGLERCADALKRAVRSIPIPSWQYEEIKKQQIDFAHGGVPVDIRPNMFFQTLIGPYAQGWAASVLKEAEDFCRGAERQAQQAYKILCTEYDNAARLIPDHAQVQVPGVNQRVGRTETAPRTAGLNQPGTGLTSPLSGLPAAQTPLPSTVTPPSTDLPPLDPPDVTTADVPDLGTTVPDDPFDPSDRFDDKNLGTSLAGAGGGGLGAGLGGGGLGKGLGNIAALGPPGMGPAATPPPGVLAARLAAGAGGLGGAGMPLMPMTPMGGAGHPGAGGDDTRGSKLQEDEDIFVPRQACSGVIDV